MPYIRPDDRPEIQEAAEKLGELCGSPGKLNYGITVVMHEVLCEMGNGYAEAASIVAALECAKLEFYRRVMAPYEDMKAAENGDILLSDGTNMATDA